MFWLLVRTRLWSTRNAALYYWRRQPVVSLARTVAALGLFGGMFACFLLFFDFAAGLRVLPETIAQAFYYLFLLLLAGAAPFVSSTLLQSEDYNLLFAAPIPPRAIIAAKMLDAAVTNSLQFAVIGIPAIVACGFAVGLRPIDWLVVPLLIALFVLMPVLITSVALLVTLAVIGMSRLRSAISLINVLMGMIVCITFVVEARNLPIRFSGSRLNAFQPALSAVSPSAHLFPSYWFATAILDLRHGPGAAVKPFATILTTDALLFLVSMALGGRLLSIASLVDGDASGRIAGRASTRRALWTRRLPTNITALIMKDFKFIMRDSMLMSQFSVPMILFVVPFVLTLQGQRFDSRNELYPLAVCIIGLIVYMQTSILSLTLLGLEARSFWVLLTSPGSRSAVLLAKWILSSCVSGGIGAILSLIAGLAFHASPLIMLLQVAVVIAIAVALCAIGVGMSALFPRFIHDNPAMRVSPWALVVGFFASSGYMLLTGIIITAGLLALARDFATAPVITICSSLFLVLTFATILVPMLLGSRRIEGYEWEH